MKKLGLIGGIGPESTISYYRDIVYGVQKQTGTSVFPPLTIESMSVFEVLKYCEEENYDGLTNYLEKGVRHLIDSGADYVAMTGNTPHIVFDALNANSTVPMISIVSTACDTAKLRGYRRVGLLGTIPTMQGTYFTHLFEQAGIPVIRPTADEIHFIGDKIEHELELGITKTETLQSFLDVIQRMVREDHIDAIVLGCTELPLLFQNVELPVPVLDTMQIHIETLISLIMEQ